MIKIENWCVGCSDMGLPCMGKSCSQRVVEVHYCDRCECQLDGKDWKPYGYDEYCDYCREVEDEEE